MPEKEPDHGWNERLDSSKCVVFLYSKDATTNRITCYRVRSNREAHEFFQLGRVFAMLWAETANATLSGHSTMATIGRFNEYVFSQIRRFIIVAVNRNRHFVYAWLDHGQRLNAYKLT
jgi:hypothetical protein